MAVVLRLGVTIVVGFVVFFLLAPTSGSGIGCSSLLLRDVPCDGLVVGAASAVAAVVVGLGLWHLPRGGGT